jgi:hypothetical protein
VNLELKGWEMQVVEQPCILKVYPRHAKARIALMPGPKDTSDFPGFCLGFFDNGLAFD